MQRCQVTLPAVDGLEPEDAKSVLRQAIRAARRERGAADRESAGRALAEHAVEAVGDAACVAAWASRPSEPDSLPTLEALAGSGVEVLLPVLGPGLQRTWARYQGPEDLAERAPGRPPEPSGEVLPAEEIARAEAVLVPALAVDAFGTRLGQGGGWYDRVLPLADPGAPVFAMLYDEELVSELVLPTAAHDAPVQAVITPTEWFLLEGSVFRTESLTGLAERTTARTWVRG